MRSALAFAFSSDSVGTSAPEISLQSIFRLRRRTPRLRAVTPHPRGSYNIPGEARNRFDLEPCGYLSIRAFMPSNVRVDAAARIQSSIAASLMMRNTLSPLASNDLFDGISDRRAPPIKFAVVSVSKCRKAFHELRRRDGRRTGMDTSLNVPKRSITSRGIPLNR